MTSTTTSTKATAPKPKTTIDPRIKARRIAVQRDEGRKRLRRLGAASAVLAVLAGLWGIAMTPLVDVDHVRVVGATHSGADAIAAGTGVHPGDAMVTVRLGRVARRVADLPWVETADVRRRWPGTIEVRVVERRPAAAVPVQGGGWLLLDAGGRELAVQPDEPMGVPRVEVPAVVVALGSTISAGTSAALTVAASVPVSLQGRLVRLRPAPGGSVEGVVRLRDGSTAALLLGRPTQLSAKWLALLSVLGTVDLARLASIDLRVPSAPALTRR